MKNAPALESESRLIIDSIPGIVALLSATGDVEIVNPQLLEYFGQTLEELTQWGSNGTVHPEDLAHVAEVFGSSIVSGTPYDILQRLRRADGEYRWMENKGFPLRDQDGTIRRWCVLLTDIHEKKQAEEALQQSEQNLKLIIDTIPALVWGARPDGGASFFNRHYLNYLGLTADQAMGWGWAASVHPQDLAGLQNTWSESLTSERPGEAEARLRRYDGGYRWFLFRVNPLRDESGKIVAWYGQNTDIEDRKRSELKVQESERQFKTIFDEAGTGITLVDLKKGEPVRNNRALQKMLGCSEEELSRFETFDRLTDEADRERDSATFNELCKGVRESLKLEKHFVLKDGRSIWANVIFTLLRDNDESPRYVIAIHEDITERKQREETFRTIVETNPECVKVINRKGTLQRVNAAGVTMSGAPSEEFILGQCFYDFVAPEDRERYRRFNENVCGGHKGFLEFDIITMQGERRHMETHAAPMAGDDGSVVQLGVTRDITERKRTLEKLQANQDLLDLAQKSAGAMAFDWQIQEELNYWSPEQEALFGLAPGTFDGRYQTWKSMMYQPDWPAVVGAIQHAQKTGVVEAEYRVVWPDASLHWLSTNGRMFFDDEGEPLRMVGFTSDVTRRKTAEVQLAGEKRLLEMVATSRALPDILISLCNYVEDLAPDCYCGVYLIDWDGPKVQLAVGPTLPAGFNAALDGLYITSETGPCALAAYERTQIIAANVETDELWKSSPFRTFALAHGLKSCWSTPIYARSGEVLGTFAIYQDKPATPTPLQQDLIAQVTHIASIAIERSQHEEALRRSEAFQAESQHLARIGSFAWNAATDDITWSEQLYRMYEFEPGVPITQELIRTRVHPGDISLYEKMKEQHQSGCKDFEWQYRLLMPDGSIKHLHAIAHPSNNHQGETEYIAAVQDVTDRKASEEALRHSESELKRANEYLTIAQELSHTGSYTREIVSDKQTLSDEMYRIMEFDPKRKVTHEMVLARIHPEDLSLFEEVQRGAIPTGDDFNAAYRIVMDDGSIKHLRSSSRRLTDITDRVVYVGATQDVTEKKLAEEALDEARSELAHAARAMSLGVLTASIAHEVSQPLSGIITNASTSIRMLDAEPPNVDRAREITQRIIRDGNRASEVITRLRTLFKKKEFTSEPVDLNDAAQEVIALSRSELQKCQVVVLTELQDNLPLVDGDRVQLQQVILNLILNAADAMGNITDRSRIVTVKSGLEKAAFVKLSVIDVGVGFAPEATESLFEAFYTTKTTGMGIGLSVSRSIVGSHKGLLWAEPNKETGATFSFTIPIHSDTRIADIKG